MDKQNPANKKAAKRAVIIEQAAAAAKIVTNTVSAVAKDNELSPATFGMPWAAIHVAQGALGLAQTIKAAKKGIADIDSETISGAAGAISGGGGSAPSAPIAPTPETTILPQAQINQITSANTTTRAYVIESDVTNNQERIVRLNRAARIN